MGDKIKTYLAGPINHKNPESFELAKKWRKDVEEKLNSIEIKCLNPLDRIGGDSISPELRSNLRNAAHRGDLDAVRKIVGGIIIPPDLDIVQESNFLTLYLPVDDEYEICGTYGESTLAKFLNIPLYIVTDRANNEIPEWLIGCSTVIFKSWDEYYKFITSRWSDYGSNGT